MEGFLIGFFVVMLAFAVLMIAAFWKVFEKAGQPGWAAIIPIYNMYVLLKIAGKPGWWLLMFFIPLVNYIFIIWMWNMVSKSFGKDEGFTVGLVLLSPVFMPILGFSRDIRYIGPYGNPQEFEARRRALQFEFEQHNQG
ncbi:MAG: hypothetical protein EOO15_10155 [Chitinophagaceae bacterium]|nr:MAG: hypothetical protein EOO15_10155 [Chitinophagaceae bacterium]